MGYMRLLKFRLSMVDFDSYSESLKRKNRFLGMKKQAITITILLILCSSFIEGQDTITTFFNYKWKKCDKEFAIYYRKAYPDSSGMWIVEDYHMNGQLQMMGKYSDKGLKKQQGPAIFYHYNGKVSGLGQYSDNKKVGFWKSYFTNGSISSEGKMTNNQADSIWTSYDINGTVFGKTNYVNGKEEGESKWYYESGKICEIATYNQGKLRNRINFDENGGVVKTTEKDCNPEFIGGDNFMVLFLQENIIYPEELKLKRKEGTVLIHFIVRKDGKIDSVEFQKSDEPSFNQEALRVFSLIKYMKPARFHGQIIESEYILPIVFKLYNW